MAMTEARFFIKGKSVSAEEFARHFNLKLKKGGKRSGYSRGKGKIVEATRTRNQKGVYKRGRRISEKNCESTSKLTALWLSSSPRAVIWIRSKPNPSTKPGG